MLSSSHLFLSSPSSLDDTNNTDGGDKEVARAPDDIKVNCLETGITSEHSSSEDVPAQPAQLADGPIDGHLHLLTSRCTVGPNATQDADSDETTDIQLPSTGGSKLLTGRTGSCEAPSPEPPGPTPRPRLDVPQPHIRHTNDSHNDQHGYDIVLDTDPSVAKLTRAGG
ncbi:hypothetical protein EDB85DRAFT_2147129 [Lactarius pseudohatsudake]|nr:hypothetical protein EDB85DRAFT_2147129 [Lactarius pseudohatsudake]